MRKLLILISMIGILLFSIGFISASECTGQNCGANTTITIGNEAPAIIYVSNPAVTLNGGTTKVVYVDFNVTDGNGYADVNSSTAIVRLNRSGEITRESLSCIQYYNDTTMTAFNCSITMQFYDSEGEWTVNATVTDNSEEAIINDSMTLTVNSLDYVTQNITTLEWTSVLSGVNDNEATNPMVITNGGNQDYNTFTITAYNSTGTTYSDKITAQSFSIDNSTGQTSGQVYMEDGTPVDITSKVKLDEHGASITRSIYFYLDLVAGLRPDTYYQDTSWAMQIST